MNNVNVMLRLKDEPATKGDLGLLRDELHGRMDVMKDDLHYMRGDIRGLKGDVHDLKETVKQHGEILEFLRENVILRDEFDQMLDQKLEQKLGGFEDRIVERISTLIQKN